MGIEDERTNERTRGGPIPTLRIRDPDLFGHLGSGREGVGTLGSHFSGQIRLSGSGIRIFLVIWDPEVRELGLPDPTFRDPARLYTRAFNLLGKIFLDFLLEKWLDIL